MFKSWLATALFWLIVGSAIFCAIGPSKTFEDCISERHNHEPYQTSQEKVPFFVKAIPLARLNAACGFIAANENTGAITGIAGVLVAFFTFALWLSTHRLWKAGEKQAEITRILAQAAVFGQRATIQITPSYEHDGDTEKILTQWKYKFGSKMDNFGNISAANLKNHIDYRLIAGDLPEDFIFPDGAPPISETGVLGAKQFLLGPHVPDGYINAADMTKIKQGTLNLYFFGWVRYFDGFPETPERSTKFCYSVRVTGHTNPPVVFYPYRRHNCADEGCDTE